MRHGKKINHLGRTKSHRVALLSNMAASLIANKRITTTLAKAKSLRKYAEPLITRSKNDTTHSRRIVFSYLQDKEALKELFGIIAEKVAERNGGYTRIIKLGTRYGDNAEMALIELVDFNDNLTKEDETSGAEAKTTRRRRGGKKAATSNESEDVTSAVEVVEEDASAAEVVEEEVKTEEKKD
ncbi:MAG: large subunit ribosomal protein L17 [Arcticibacterium sp.]|jgi:large subunit ribosomal protein L17